MMSCEEATRLMSEQQERPLKLREKAGLTMHTAICSGCREFGRQMHTLRDLIRRDYSASNDSDSEPSDSDKK